MKYFWAFSFTDSSEEPVCETTTKVYVEPDLVSKYAIQCLFNDYRRPVTNILRAGALLTLLVIGSFIALNLRRERIRRREGEAPAEPNSVAMAQAAGRPLAPSRQHHHG